MYAYVLKIHYVGWCALCTCNMMVLRGAERGYHAQISNPGFELKHPVMSLSRHFVMTPLEDGLRLAGTAEFAALDAKPDFRRAKVLLKQAAQLS